MSDLGFCVHGHFYQPSREDPISGKIPEEVGAFPYKNWNELILSHCYGPNAELGNFERISFNFGPTLLNWMEYAHPNVLQNIVSQDRQNYEKHGVGNALAQPYHHTILPLSSREDKITQIHWGIEDFFHRFEHEPTGMWLPEAAVDLETLEIMADFGIEFTILAPWQAQTHGLDVTQPYFVNLSTGKQITIFFYHQDLSTQISFNPLSTINADLFATNSIYPILKNTSKEGAKYLIIASDGELYGHHQPFRDKFLEHLMNGSLKNKNIRLLYPALWLREHPATEEVKIIENTSWSCHHGVDRWSIGCDCTPHSEWKRHLRTFAEFVGNIVNDVYLTELKGFSIDIWQMRHNYIDVLLGKISENEFVKKYIPNIVDRNVENRIIILLKAQNERQRIFTSCGWFFEDFDRIEPHNILAYCSQALNYVSAINGIDYYDQCKPLLSEIKSIKTGKTAMEVFKKFYKRVV
ncbi:MAG TPA: DUF3536 domain-containing protein [Anaerolineaceae bacterium]|nr:DUF3536 domain-containing protein [Anaerolineaceae bacterium]